MMTWRISVAISLLLGLKAVGADPGWWATGSPAVSDPNVSHPAASNYAPVNLGQLKFMAKRAMLHLDEKLAAQGGAGSEVHGVVEALKPQSGQGLTPAQIEQYRQDNYAPANIGQLKALAKPFYKRLLEAGYDTRQNLIAHGYPSSWLFAYAWNPSAPISGNYVPANIGQLKVTFSFDLTVWPTVVDGDNNGILDVWESSNFGAVNVAAGADGDGDGLTNLTEFLMGTDPNSKDFSGPAFVATGLQVYTSLINP